ncbi:MAG: glycosyltransferase [Clostridia bacterium]|nr:glycosyltransferase [Clostridia bacterium]
MFKDDSDIEMVYCSPEGSIRDALLARDVAFLPLDKFSKQEIKRAINEYAPDIIHAHDMRAAYLTVKVAGRIPVICHIHNNDKDMIKISKKSVAFLLSSFKIKHIFWVSDSAFDSYLFKTFIKKKSSVLYNVISVDECIRKSNSEMAVENVDVVYVGRFSYQKNIERFLYVCKKIVNEIGNVKVALLGDGPNKSDLIELSKELKIDNNVEFLGFVDNPLAYVAKSKVMLMTSRFEGTPMAALEAMALGTPIVSTPTDGLKYIVDEGVTGYLSDDDDNLARSAIKIILDDSEYARLSEASILRSKKLNDVSLYRAKLKEAYARCIK